MGGVKDFDTTQMASRRCPVVGQPVRPMATGHRPTEGACELPRGA